MHVLGLLSVTLPTDEPAATRQWWIDTIGLPVNEDDPRALHVGDPMVRFGAERAIRLAATGLDDGPLRLVDPTGTVVELIEPDYEAGRRAEETIREFVGAQAELPGPPVDDLADAVSTIIGEAHERVAVLLADVPHNKVLATQLALSQRARDAAPADTQWPLHAASSLMSGFIIAGAQGG